MTGWGRCPYCFKLTNSAGACPCQGYKWVTATDTTAKTCCDKHRQARPDFNYCPECGKKL